MLIAPSCLIIKILTAIRSHTGELSKHGGLQNILENVCRETLISYLASNST